MGALYLGNTLVAPVVQGKPDGVEYPITEYDAGGVTLKKIERTWGPIDLAGANLVGNSAFASYYNTYSERDTSYTGPAIINAGNPLNLLENSFIYAFRGTGVSSTGLSNLATVTMNYALYYAFHGCSNLKNANLENLEVVNGSYTLYYSFYNSGLEVLDLSSLRFVGGTYSFAYAFSNCSLLREVNISNLHDVAGSSSMISCFANCTSLTTLSFDVLDTLTLQLFNSAFKNSGLQHLYFPALTQITGNIPTATNTMLNGVTGCTVHLPRRLSGSVTANMFGGTNTVLLFDQGEIATINVTIPANVDFCYVQDNIIYITHTQQTVTLEVDPTKPIIVYASSNTEHKLFVKEIPAEDYVINFNDCQYEATQIIPTSGTINPIYCMVQINVNYDQAQQNYWFNIHGSDVIYVSTAISSFSCITTYRQQITQNSYITSSPETTSATCNLGDDIYIDLYNMDAYTYTAADMAQIFGLQYGVPDNGWTYTTYTDENQNTYDCIRILAENTTNWHSSKAITISQATQDSKTFVDTVSCMPSSELNYDYGYVFIGQVLEDFTAGQVKNNSTPQMFKRGGVETSFTMYGTSHGVVDGQNITVSIGYANDNSQTAGDNGFYVESISVCVFNPIQGV